MATSKRRTTYPWGTVQPRTRLRETSQRLRKALDAVGEGGFGGLAGRVKAVVGAARPLVDALDHLSGTGLRSTEGSTPVAHTEVSAVAQATHGAVGELAAASVLTLSERYRALSDTLGALLDISDRVLECGIAASVSPSDADPWKTFGV